MAQFTIPGIPGGKPGDKGHNGFRLDGIVAWALAGGGGGSDDFEISPFDVANIVPAPGAMALLGLGGLTMGRRRRRH